MGKSGKHRSKKSTKNDYKRLEREVERLRRRINGRKRPSSSSESDYSGSCPSAKLRRASCSSEHSSHSESRGQIHNRQNRVRSRSRSCSASVRVASHSAGQPDKEVRNDKEDQSKQTNASVSKKLDILGENPSSNEQKEIKLHPDLVARWKHWMSSGITESVKDDLLKNYPRKGDCLLEPPQLNPEIKTPMTDVAKKRDDHFQDLQRLVGSALSSVGLAISDLLGEEEFDPFKQLQLLSDAGKLLTEMFHSISVARRAFITPGYTKVVRDILESATDNPAFLFGDKLNEKVTEAKTFEKLGRDMKGIQGNKNNSSRQPLNSRSSSLRKPETSRMSRGYSSRMNHPDYKRSKSTAAPTSRRHQATSNYPKFLKPATRQKQ
ncbi:uncharacterized protein LOC122500502 [Leptopilina heterotoma]|uniref:uncharacterized protein LOC122500502 n=1 Tax=Leptopilina heterotoma TaxID=63436 RepID=UPI001CA93252|nr:uncharacterized protein LOC122500502 [Leptopilina heterotoma]